MTYCPWQFLVSLRGTVYRSKSWERRRGEEELREKRDELNMRRDELNMTQVRLKGKSWTLPKYPGEIQNRIFFVNLDIWDKCNPYYTVHRAHFYFDFDLWTGLEKSSGKSPQIEETWDQTETECQKTLFSYLQCIKRQGCWKQANKYILTKTCFTTLINRNLHCISLRTLYIILESS